MLRPTSPPFLIFLLLPLLLVAQVFLSGCELSNSEQKAGELGDLSHAATEAFASQGAYDGALAEQLSGTDWQWVVLTHNPSISEVGSIASKDDTVALVPERGFERAIIAVDSYPTPICQVLSGEEALPVRDDLDYCFDQLTQEALDDAAAEMPAGAQQAKASAPADLAVSDDQVAWTISRRSAAGPIFTITELTDGRQWRSCQLVLEGGDRRSCSDYTGTFEPEWPSAAGTID